MERCGCAGIPFISAAFGKRSDDCCTSDDLNESWI